MKNLKANIKELWRGSKWHMLSIVFTYAFTFVGNVYNFMGLRDAVFNFAGFVFSQYFFQLFICGFGSYLVAYVIEVKQIKPGNNTEPFWKKYARPDIWVATVLGIIGCILAILTYIHFY